MVVLLDDVDRRTKKQRLSFQAKGSSTGPGRRAGGGSGGARSAVGVYAGRGEKGQSFADWAARHPGRPSGVHPVAKDPKYADFAADLKNKVPADKWRPLRARPRSGGRGPLPRATTLPTLRVYYRPDSKS